MRRTVPLLLALLTLALCAVPGPGGGCLADPHGRAHQHGRRGAQGGGRDRPAALVLPEPTARPGGGRRFDRGPADGHVGHARRGRRGPRGPPRGDARPGPRLGRTRPREGGRGGPPADVRVLARRRLAGLADRTAEPDRSRRTGSGRTPGCKRRSRAGWTRGRRTPRSTGPTAPSTAPRRSTYDIAQVAAGSITQFLDAADGKTVMTADGPVTLHTRIATTDQAGGPARREHRLRQHGAGHARGARGGLALHHLLPPRDRAGLPRVRADAARLRVRRVRRGGDAAAGRLRHLGDPAVLAGASRSCSRAWP